MFFARIYWQNTFYYLFFHIYTQNTICAYILAKLLLGSHFGYSIDGYRDSGGEWHIISGAPTLQKNSRRTGGVFECPISQLPNDCQEINEDLTYDEGFENSMYGQAVSGKVTKF